MGMGSCHACRTLPGDLDEVLPGHLDGVLPGHMDGRHMDIQYGRVFPSKTLRNVPAFAQAYARANARAKVKGGGVYQKVGVKWVWHGCDLYVLPRQLPGQNENGLLSWMGFCPGTWMADTWVLPGHRDGVLPGHMDGVLPGDAYLPGWGFAWAHG